MYDELIGRFVFVGTKSGTVIEATPAMLRVKLHHVRCAQGHDNVIVEVQRRSIEWRLKYPKERRA